MTRSSTIGSSGGSTPTSTSRATLSRAPCHPRWPRLPLIIPIVVTHGPRGQRTRRDLIDLVDITGIERERLAASATETGLEAVRDVVRYVLEVHQQLDVERLAAIAATVHPFAGDEIMTTARELLDRGRAEGRAEGKAEGRRATLRRLLTLKFRSAVTPSILEALAVADAETLDRWEERLLTATTVEDVLV